jgi:uncharacterized protein
MGTLFKEPPMTQPTDNTPRKRGFALLDADKMKQVAALGGRTAHAAGRAHQFSREEARAAARRSVEVRTRRAAEARGTAGSDAPSA